MEYGFTKTKCFNMADDLDDEWWKDESAAEKSREEQRGVKRAASPDDSEDEGISSDEKSHTASKQRPASQNKQKGSSKLSKAKKKKTKNSRGKFVRKKISEDEGSLSKLGTPADVQALLQFSPSTRQSDDASSESDDEDNISLETDFFPANQQLSSEEYLKEILPGWQQVVKKASLPPGSPVVLILCSSAIRAVQLNREIKPFLGKECKTAKLFAKHMKLEEQKKFLEKNVCHACIGTPSRIQSLLESGSLKLDRALAFVLDWNWRDVKLKRMVDIPDVLRDLTLLLKVYVVDRIRDRGMPCKIAIL